MGFIYTVSEKQLLEIRNKIVLQTAIPTLLNKGFCKTPFSSSWYGRNNVQDFSYELCRLTTDSQLEFIEVYVARGDKWIKFTLNIFNLDPVAESLKQLNGGDSLQFKLSPNSMTEMRLRSDDIKGPPIFSLKYMSGHKLSRFYTNHGLTHSIKVLTRTIETDLNNIDHFVKRWHELHSPMTTDWAGQRVVKK